MNLSVHFTVTLILSIFLFPVFGIKVLLLFVLGFFIDVDHYLWHVFKDGNLSLKKAYKMDKDKSVKKTDLLHILHVFEFWLPMLILGFFNEWLFLLSFGLVVHLLLDFIHMLYTGAEHARTMSVISWLTRH